MRRCGMTTLAWTCERADLAESRVGCHACGFAQAWWPLRNTTVAKDYPVASMPVQSHRHGTQSFSLLEGCPKRRGTRQGILNPLTQAVGATAHGVCTAEHGQDRLAL